MRSSGTPPSAVFRLRSHACAAESSEPTIASSERNSRTNSAASCQGFEPGSSCRWPFARRESVAVLTPMTGARSACARPRKRAARIVARDRVVAASAARRGREVRRAFISLEIICFDRFHSKTARAPAASRSSAASSRHSAVLVALECLGDGLLLAGCPSWKSAASAVARPSLPFFLARRRAAWQARSSPSSASDPGAHGHVAARAGGGMVHQQSAHPIAYHLRVLRGLLRGLPLRQDREGSAFPAPDQVAATTVGGGDDPRHAADAGIAGRAVELLVVGTEIVDVEECQTDLVRLALRQLPVPQQQLLEVGA